MATYDPNKTNINEDRIADWLRSQISSETSLTEIPGVGPANLKLLGEGEGSERVTNVFQLFGKFLSLKGPDDGDHVVTSPEHMDKMYAWLKAKGINSKRGEIVRSVAEKVDGFMPGIYDADVYDSGL